MLAVRADIPFIRLCGFSVLSCKKHLTSTLTYRVGFFHISTVPTPIDLFWFFIQMEFQPNLYKSVSPAGLFILGSLYGTTFIHFTLTCTVSFPQHIQIYCLPYVSPSSKKSFGSIFELPPYWLAPRFDAPLIRLYIFFVLSCTIELDIHSDL